MRIAVILLAVLLAACARPPTEDLADVLAADPVRLKALRAQCETDRQAAGEDACHAAAEAFRRRFFSGDAGPDEFNALDELPLIPPSFDTPPEDVQDGDEEPVNASDTEAAR